MISTTQRAIRCMAAVLVSSLVLGLAGAAQATILNFTNHPITPFPVTVSESYGDNVASAGDGGFAYGDGGEGFTPNVTADWPSSPDPNNSLIIYYASNIGADRLLIPNQTAAQNNQIIKLTADPGYLVTLSDFVFYNVFAGPAFTYVRIRDSQGDIQEEALAVVITNYASGGTTFAEMGFSPVTDTELTLEIFSAFTGDYYAVDNITFSQSEAADAVPEPSTLALAGLGLAGTVALAWRRKRG